MPLTAKGEDILAAMKREYGDRKGEEVFYASKNSGQIAGVDSVDWNARLAACDAALSGMATRMDSLEAARGDAEFNESDHPRDEGGKFGHGGGSGSGTNSSEAKAAQERILARKQKMRERSK